MIGHYHLSISVYHDLLYKMNRIFLNISAINLSVISAAYFLFYLIQILCNGIRAAIVTVRDALRAVGQPDDVSVSFQDEDLVVTTGN